MAPKIEKFEIDNVSKRDRIFLAFTISLVLFYGFYEFEYKKVKLQEKKLASQISKINAPLELIQKSLQDTNVKNLTYKIKILEERISQLRKDIKGRKKALKGKSLEVLNGLQASATKHGVMVKNIRIKEKEFKRGKVDIKELSLILVLNSDYNSLKRYMASLKEFPVVLGVKSLETRRDEDIMPLVETRLFLKLFLL